MKILIVEDWWADRLRFEYLLEHVREKVGPAKEKVDNVEDKTLKVVFAWSAGRPQAGGGVWTVNRIVEEADYYDRIIVDLALNKKDEDRFREAHEWSDEDFREREESLDKEITGLQLLAALAAKKTSDIEAKQYLRDKCIVASAHVYDRLRDHCLKKWGVIDTFHKWSDEDRIIQTLFESKLRSYSGE